MIVLYIAGAGRSGSTLLELILGNLPDFFSVGEVRHLWEYVDIPDIHCGCGAKLKSCIFWSQVLENLGEENLNFQKIQELSLEVDRTRNLIPLSVDITPQKKLDQLIAANQLLYQNIFDASNAKFIVDSSKVPSHFHILSKIPDIDLRVLHLIRDGRAVAYSWNKRRKSEDAYKNSEIYMPQRGTYSSLIRWVIENIFTLYFSRNLKYKSLLRYEDFTKSPFDQMVRVLDELNLPTENLSPLKMDTFPIASTHSVGGNPIRFDQKQLLIHQDTSWKKTLSRTELLTQGFIIYPMLNHFGYKI